jgi:hypothetical protein
MALLDHELALVSFLSSEVVSLQAGQSGPLFKIHSDLFGSKCKAIMSAFRNGFEEAQKGVYTFQDTSAGALGQFIEWAYTGNYPTVLNAYSPVQSETKEAGMLRIKLWKTDVRRTLRLIEDSYSRYNSFMC